MPSGKIISFENGEVSPSLRFKTTLAAFATGLSKAFNFLVNKSGGVSNRSGFQYMFTPVYQDNLEVPGKVRLFGFNVSRVDNEDDEQPCLLLQTSENTTQPEIFGLPTSIAALTAERDLTNVKMSQIGNIVVFSNGLEHWAIQRGTVINGIVPYLLQPKSAIIQGGVATITKREINPSSFGREVLYAIYQVFRNGEEVLYGTYTGGAQPMTSGSTIVHNRLDIPLSDDDDVKHYNLYRAATSNGGDPSGWGLVARIPRPSVAGNIAWNDYIEVADITQPPPDEDYLYGDYPSGKQLFSSRLVGHYQQRRVVVVNSGNSKLDEGSIAMSKAGSVNQMDTQVIFTPIGAFDFTIPIGIKSKVVAMMELERLILLTTDVVVAVLGDRQGLVTPGNVNPSIISYVGCSERVTPAYAGTYGFYMSKNDERLMRISFTIDGNIDVSEISILSDHILKGSKVKEMTLTRGREDVLWLLKYDGTLVSVTLHEGGEVTGWARHETDGFIESISALTQTRRQTTTITQDNESYDALVVLVVRNGVRLIEKLSLREDSATEYYSFADSSMQFGSRLKFDAENNHYFNFDNDDDGEHFARDFQTEYRTNTYSFKIGHGLLTTNDSLWEEGQTLNLEASSGFLFGNISDGPVVMDFFYDDGGVEKSVRWTQTGDAQAPEFGAANSAPGEFNGDVPSELRAALTSRCTRVKKIVKELFHLVGITEWNNVRDYAVGERVFYLGGIPVKNRVFEKQNSNFPSQPIVDAGDWTEITTGTQDVTEVAILADGKVLSSPNNPYYDSSLYVNDIGELDLGDYYGWGYVGLPYDSEMETLDLDTSDERTLTDAKKLVNRVGVAFEETKGGYIGQTGKGEDLSKMQRVIHREDEQLEESTKNINEHIDVPFPGEWEKTGRVLIKQVDPLPMSVLAVYPKGIAGD